MLEQGQRASEIRNWVQAFIVVGGVLAGVWEFVFKEVWMPASAPINITTDVSVKEAGFRGTSSDRRSEQYEAIELFVTAKNPSTRDVFLLNSCWYAEGLSIRPGKALDQWTDDVSKAIKQSALRNDKGAYFELDHSVLVASGGLFPEDQWLHPNEAISTSFLIYVQQGTFDVLYVHVQMPTTAVNKSVEVDWAVAPNKACTLRLFRVRNGSRAEEITNYVGATSDPKIQFQIETSTRELSLWQSNPH
jgi:hypothetical protein